MAKKNPIPNKSSFTIKGNIERTKPDATKKTGKDLRCGKGGK